MTRLISRRKAMSNLEWRPGTELSPQIAPPKRTYLCRFSTSLSLSVKSRVPVMKTNGGGPPVSLFPTNSWSLSRRIARTFW